MENKVKNVMLFVACISLIVGIVLFFIGSFLSFGFKALIMNSKAIDVLLGLGECHPLVGIGKAVVIVSIIAMAIIDPRILSKKR